MLDKGVAARGLVLCRATAGTDTQGGLKQVAGQPGAGGSRRRLTQQSSQRSRPAYFHIYHRPNRMAGFIGAIWSGHYYDLSPEPLHPPIQPQTNPPTDPPTHTAPWTNPPTHPRTHVPCHNHTYPGTNGLADPARYPFTCTALSPSTQADTSTQSWSMCVHESAP